MAANDCLSLNVTELKRLLVQNRVPGRSRLTTKQAICAELIRLGLFASVSPIQPPQQNLFDDIQTQLSNLNIQEPTERQVELQTETNNPEFENELAAIQTQLTNLNVQEAQNIIDTATQNIMDNSDLAAIQSKLTNLTVQEAQIENLPLNLKLKILNRLDRATLINICELNRSWFSICKDEQLWQQLVILDFGEYRWGRSLPKIISSASWYSNYKVYLWRQRLFLSRLSQENILRLLSIYQDELSITDQALSLLQTVLTPWVLQFSRIPNLPDLIVPYLTRRLWRLAYGALREYRETNNLLAVVDLIITYIIFTAGNSALGRDIFVIDYPTMYNTIYRTSIFNVPFGVELPLFDVNAR